MTQEEKLNEAKKLYESANADQRYVLESLFPELKESDNKRMIQYFKDLAPFDKADELYEKYGFSHKDAIAWLEKQAEHANFRNKIQIGDKVTRNEDGVLVNLSQLKRVAKPAEEQGEQKPIVNDNAKEMFIKALERVEEQNNKGYKLTDCDKNSWWEDFKAYTSCTIEQKPAAWSDEDEKMFEHIIAKATLHFSSINYLDEEEINFLKSLRPQNNITDEELAQAKKNAYNDALDKIEYHSGNPTFDDGWSAAIWYLKKRNAMPQNQWKPSEEQMNTLEYYMHTLICNEHKEVLFGLYADLKKLKE